MRLRLVTWNCGMAIHKKVEPLLALLPDLAILPECAEPDVIRTRAPTFSFTDCEWSVLQSTKGLGVFSFGGLSMRRHQSWDRAFHLFLPLEIRGSLAPSVLQTSGSA
jgi:exodeoxyribonuclease III